MTNDPHHERHHERLSTVETRQKTLEDNFTSFTKTYTANREQDRRENKEAQELIFGKLNQIGANMTAITNEISAMKGSQGRIPASLIIGLPAVIVPLVTLLGVFVWQVITPLSDTLAEERSFRAEEHDRLVETRIMQARIEERQNFILKKYHE